MSINFTPLYGCGEDEPFCGLLTLDGYNLLLDCGWDENFNEDMLLPLKEVIPDIDAVLISHPSIKHIGALPYAVGKLGLSAPIYCTLPVYRMGQMFMYDAYQALSSYNFTSFDLDDVDAAFDEANMIYLKYSQDKYLSDKGDGITITPYAAGHMLGGSVWKIKKETEDIIYAVNYNHKRDRHLNGTVLESFDSRPSVLITDANCPSQHTVPLKTRDAKLRASVMETLRRGGNVLLPVDSAGRVLELMLVLHNFWTREAGCNTYELVFLSNMAYNTVEAARSQLEWMSRNLLEMFDRQRDNPFSLKKLTLCHSMEELLAIDRQYVCLATSAELHTGFAQEVFLRLAANPLNLVLFTQRNTKGTLAHDLLKSPTPASVTFMRRVRVELKGKELLDYRERERLTKEQKAFERSEAIEVMSDIDEDDDVEEISKFVQLKPMFPMFPDSEEKRVSDAYGEIINPEDYCVKAKEKKVLNVVDEDEEMPEEEDVPAKTVLRQSTVAIQCQVGYVDFEGRVDTSSTYKVVSRLAPRRLIVIHGPQVAKEAMRDSTKQSCNEVFIPLNGQCVDITSETNIHRVHLRESLIQSLDFAQVGEYEIAYAEGQVEIDYSKASLPLVEQAPANRRKGHNGAVFLGTLTFKMLASVLNSKGFKAEFYEGGALVCCDGLINLRKVSATQIKIEGCLTEEYFQIRDILYGLYEIL